MTFITPLILFLKNSHSVRKALTPGLISSLFMSVLFILVRKVPPVCKHMPSFEENECTFDWREVEIGMFLLSIIVIKNRASVSAEQMITSTLMYTKLASAVLFYRLDPRFAIGYCLLCVFRLWLLPDYFVDGPEELTYFSDTTLQESLEEDKRVTWVVLFYTTWSPHCHSVSPVFSELSNEYATKYLKFAKIDIGKYSKAAKTYGVSASTMSHQLPTIIVFEDGKAVDWRPMLGSNKKFVKYVFTEENIKRDFGMNKLYDESLAKCKKFKKGKKEE
ncbi:thioredoxin-related transmembrane protein 2-B [Ciona intestinalis]